jgi:hypothetical protein
LIIRREGFVLAKAWKAVGVYEGLYLVSEDGEIKSLITGDLMTLKPGLNGYIYANLTKNRKKRRVLVHRVVASAFLPNPDGLPQVNHKDENPHNNRVSNLEWCDGYYNTHYGTGLERKAEKIRKPVFQLSLDGSRVARHRSITEASSASGVNPNGIIRCCRRAGNTAGGFMWAYA